MAKVRVYELAKELDRDNKSLEEVIRGLGIQIKNYMSTLTQDEAQRVRSAMGAPPPVAAPTVAPKSNPPARRSRDRDQDKDNDNGGAGVIRRKGAEVRRRRAEREAEEAAQLRKEEEEQDMAARARPVVRPQSPPPRPPAMRPEPSAVPPRPAAPITRTPSAGPEVRHPNSVSADPRRVDASAQAAMARPSAPTSVAPSNGSLAGVPMSSDASASRAAAPSGGGSDDDAPRGPGGPAVGTRIELPKGSRRLPGGMASRMEGGPVSQTPPPRERPASQQAPMERAPSGQVGSPQHTTSSVVQAKGEGKPDDRGVVSRVVRNEEGVIVGAAKQRSEPKILGFIPLAQTRKRQQVIITDASDEDKRGRASQRKQREERHQAQGRRRKMTRRGRAAGPGGGPKVSTVEMSEEKKRVRVDEAIQVSELAHQMGQKATNVLRTLWGIGLRGITINHAIDLETAELVAAEYGYTVDNVTFQENEFLDAASSMEGESRAPVVTVMGHVDHGKTSLLDYIRKAKVASGEAGGITQHIGAYKVDTKRGEVVFLDTPGHEAFTAMRERGAQITDIVVLIVAADDGVMPTTIEAIKHARASNVPIVVAINKIDKPEANPGRVKQALMEFEIVGEEFGGSTPIVEISAKTGKGVEELLETLALQAELLELTALQEGRAKGVVLEARIDKGRGTVATVLVQAGKLRTGDIVVANEFHGKARSLFNQAGKKLKEAGPSTPVEILGLSGVPAAGDTFNVVENDKDAKTLVAYRREQRKRKESVRSAPNIKELLSRKKVPVLKIVLKADVQGSAQALASALEELSTEKVKVEVLKSEVGQINETDVRFAQAGDAVIFGFNVKTTGKAAPMADSEGVQIRTFSVIYEATEACEELMIGLLEPEFREREQGEAEVRALFPIPRLGVVAGCRVIKGSVTRSSHVRVVRDGDILFKGVIGSLRVHKDDVKEVGEGFECGIVVDGFPEIEEGDIIQAFAVEAIPPTL